MKNELENKFKRTFHNMHNRCKDISGAYKNISVCKRWYDYKLFKKDLFDKYKKHHKKYNGDTTLERLDYDKDYKPSNCDFSTIAEQQINRHNNINITYHKNIHCLAEWSRLLNMKYITLWKRLKEYGWNSFKTLNQPIRVYRKFN